MRKCCSAALGRLVISNSQNASLRSRHKGMQEEGYRVVTLKVPLHSDAIDGRDYSQRDLRREFRQILDKHSTTRVLRSHSPEYLNSLEYLMMAVTMDLFRAILECWQPFITELFVHLELARLNADLKADLRHRQTDFSCLRRLAKLLRDLHLAFQHTYDSMSLHPEQFDAARLRGIKLEFKDKVEELIRRADETRQMKDSKLKELDSELKTRMTKSNEAQEKSLKRLTVLAEIFLPFSLACSLLSMSIRVVDLGFLWYDFFGLSTTIMFLTFTTYLWMRRWDRYPHKPPRIQKLRWPILSLIVEISRISWG
ncbi:hypothetical protein BDY21DRAFT_55453 [Lineolata rhizophorae]|uniref:Uncharacterized protein n=1 Tax=Lineolata rhizophorae TaxID=578093 RepID=A0A6A6NW97_9PEZI|nr:hypothetical protein BDY21DRAFT_55453 [Lineolata rhizophorae]